MALRADRRHPRDTGAAAVEFALVLPVLCALLFGLIDYGLWFDNSLNVRQGIRETAREAVVTCSGDGPCEKDMSAWATTAKENIGAITGTSHVHFIVPAGGWHRGQTLTVCGIVKTDGVTGLVPLPAGGFVTAVTHMSIEVDTDVPAGVYPNPVDADPSGDGWSWCK